MIYHGNTLANGWRSWIVVIDVEHSEQDFERLTLAADLWTAEDIIVRNDYRYLCALSPTGTSTTGRHREWISKVWDLESPTSRPLTLQIPELAIGELGHDLVFEIFDTQLYAISTQAPFDMDEPQWISHYTCFRFPLQNPLPSRLEKLKIWRRDHKEGPINDLWTDLRLHRDESTGELIIVEARKEWKDGSSTQRRTWYKQRLPARFTSSENGIDDEVEMPESSDQDDDASQSVAVNQTQTLAAVSSSIQDPPYLLSVPPSDDPPEHGPPGSRMTLDQRPTHPRLLCNTHTEYSPNIPVPETIEGTTLAKSRYRAYDINAAAFLDIVVDDRQGASQSQSKWNQQLRLRVGARREATPLDHEGFIHQHLVDLSTGQLIDGSETHYQDLGIHLWPPQDAPAALQDLLNDYRDSGDRNDRASGYGTVGDIIAISDERSIVYLVKKKRASDDDWGRLILINFDHNVRFWHEEWTPDFLRLYHHHTKDSSFPTTKLADQVAMEGMLERASEPPVDMDIDESANEDSNDEELGASDESNEELKFMPADDINDRFWCEEYPEDEPVDVQWFMEDMALWTEIQQGFCFE
ncbi:MAG: hypothetical protein Q9201_005721 [Fulgogasparrea decipioides]